MSSRKEEFFEFIEKAKHLLLEGKEEVLKSSKIGKMLLEISASNREKNQLFKKIGKEIYESDLKDSALPDSIQKSIVKLKELDEKIKVQENKISDLKKQAK
ncbi:MAG: hypothetical protein HYW47_07845 [Deltaproteobacteria bacterium]|nr:hypothetical protein [Deltaproteobacteria bacterium]